MPHRPLIAFMLSIVSTTAVCGAIHAATESRHITRAHAGPAIEHRAYFERNAGQFDAAVLFAGRGFQQSIFVTSTGVVVASREGVDRVAPIVMAIPVSGRTEVVGAGTSEGTVSYLRGDRSDRWVHKAPTFERVVYRNAGEGIDLEFYERDGQLEYDVNVEPGADVSQFRISFTGSTTRIDATGGLIVERGGSTLRTKKPTAFQERAGSREHVPVNFVTDDAGGVRFDLGAYDRTRTLTIDPPIVYSTLYGGTSSDEIEDLAVGLDGSVYVCGITFSPDLPTPGGMDHELGDEYDFFVCKFAPGGRDLVFATYFGGNSGEFGPHLAVDLRGSIVLVGATFSTDYPVVNALHSTPVGALEGVVTKFAPDGASLIYSTYIGGSMNDYVVGVALRPDGAAVISGLTESANFPVDSASPHYGGGQDGYIAEITSSGASLVAARYIPGNAFEFMGDVAIDLAGKAYFSAYSESSNFAGGNASEGKQCLVTADPSWMTITQQIVDVGQSGRIFGFSMKMRHGGLVFAGYRYIEPGTRAAAGNDAITFATDLEGHIVASHVFAGGASDVGRDVAIDPDGRVFMVADTSSTDLPTLNAPFQAGFGGGEEDVYFAELDPVTFDVLASGYFGGSDYDEANALVSDTLGNLFIAGTTASPNFVVTNGAYQTELAGAGDSYVTKARSANDSGVFALGWLPPADGTTATPPRALVASRSQGGLDAAALKSNGAFDIARYRIYRAANPGVQPSPDSFFFDIPAELMDTGPIVPGGGYFVVTAVSIEGNESAPSNEVGAGVGEASINGVTLKPRKLVIAGTGFTVTVDVELDGIPFAMPAKVKRGTKVNQKGALQTGQTVSAYLDAHNGMAVVSVRNANGATASYRLVR